jgi:hypothetical protein
MPGTGLALDHPIKIVRHIAETEHKIIAGRNGHLRNILTAGLQQPIGLRGHSDFAWKMKVGAGETASMPDLCPKEEQDSRQRRHAT